MRILVVIPALNEAAALAGLLNQLLAPETGLSPADVFVSASCSSDATTEVALEAGCRVVTTTQSQGRGRAIRGGVDRALADAPDAEAVWIVHADSSPPVDAVSCIRSALADPAVVGGAFEQRFQLTDCPWWTRRQLRFVVFLNRLRYRRSGVYFGDQGIFARVEALQAIGGMPAWDLFEDVELCDRLRGQGSLVLVAARMTTSPRRFIANGPVRQLLRDARMLLRHRTHGDGQRYAEAYASRRG